MAKPVYFYGIHAIDALLQQRPTDALALFIQQGRHSDASIHAIIELAQDMGVSVQMAHKDKLTQLCASPQHQGVVLHARPLACADEAQLDGWVNNSDCLFLILDQITDAHNFGACLRTAAAMGVTAVICPKHHAASLTPTVAKVSVGASELIDVVVVSNLARTLAQLKRAGVFVFGTALQPAAKSLYECDFTGKVAVVMGSEGEGMRRLTSEHCDELVYIPMLGSKRGRTESLNVSVATGMVLYEVTRQRLMAVC